MLSDLTVDLSDQIVEFVYRHGFLVPRHGLFGFIQLREKTLDHPRVIYLSLLCKLVHRRDQAVNRRDDAERDDSDSGVRRSVHCRDGEDMLSKAQRQQRDALSTDNWRAIEPGFRRAGHQS